MSDGDSSVLGKLRRSAGITSIALQRTVAQARGEDAGRFWSRVGGVCLAVALMLIVTGIGVGIATQSTVYSDDVDYWITPETDGGSSVLVDTDAPKFGSVHSTAERITGFDDVQYATPVLTHIVRLQSPDGTTEYVLAMGIVGNPAVDRVSGIETTGLTPGDPYYGSGNGTANWTGEMVFSAGAGSLLGVSEGDPITVRQPTVSANQSFSVAGVDDGERQGSQFPIVVMQLSELQSITGADSGDQAEQILVVADSQAAQAQLSGIYPQSTVETRSGITSQQVLDDELPLALSITAFLIAIIVGTLFVMTMTGLEVSADRKQLATLAAIGLSGGSRFTLLAVQTTTVTVVGGILGVLLGFAGLRLVNEIATRTLTSVSVATAEPFMIAYGLAVAVVIALLSMPYVALLLRRVGTVSEVME